MIMTLTEKSSVCYPQLMFLFVVSLTPQCKLNWNCPIRTVYVFGLAPAYTKCLLHVVGLSKYSSVTAMLLQLGVPSFNTVLHNAELGFYTRLSCLTGAVVDALRLINSHSQWIVICFLQGWNWEKRSANMEPCSFSLFLFCPFPVHLFLSFASLVLVLALWHIGMVYCSGKLTLWYKPCQASTFPVPVLFLCACMLYGYISAIFVDMRVCLNYS